MHVNVNVLVHVCIFLIFLFEKNICGRCLIYVHMYIPSCMHVNVNVLVHVCIFLIFVFEKNVCGRCLIYVHMYTFMYACECECMGSCMHFSDFSVHDLSINEGQLSEQCMYVYIHVYACMHHLSIN
jgi:hypothetical protein